MADHQPSFIHKHTLSSARDGACLLQKASLWGGMAVGLNMDNAGVGQDAHRVVAVFDGPAIAS